MRLTKQLFGIALTAVVGSVMVSCSNEFKAPDSGGNLNGGLKLAKSAEVTAWSGNQYFSTSPVNTQSVSTREGEKKKDPIETYEYEAHDHSAWDEKFKSELPKEKEYADLTKQVSDFENEGKAQEYFNNANVWVVPADFGGEDGAALTLMNNVQVNNRDIYILGNVTEFNNFQNLGKVNIYIFEDGQLDNFGPTSGDIYIYNTGYISIKDDANIREIYNKGDVNFKIKDIKDALILNSTGDVYLPEDANLKCYADIHGIVYCAGGKLTIQNTHDQYVCGIVTEQDVYLTGGNLYTGYILANTLEFNGTHIHLYPYAYMNLNKMIVPNSNCEVYCANESFALIDTEDIQFRNQNNFNDTYSLGIYFKVSGEIDIEEIIDIEGELKDVYKQYTLEEYIQTANGKEVIDRFNFSLKGQSLCGDYWEVEETFDDPCPNIKDEVEGSGCPHGKSHHNDDNECDICKEKNLDSDCNPDYDPEKPGPGGSTDKEDPKEPTNPETCPKCEHGWHGTPGKTHCDECGDDDGCNHEEPIPGSPESEVEVNLSVNDEHYTLASDGISDLVAKLSIHVRMAGDVQIVIPMTAEMYLSSDDLVVLNKHENGLFEHGGPESVTYKVGGHDVSLIFEYKDNCITVTTSGITEDVFNYCVENYGDGINFEVWMYMNEHVQVSKQEFKEQLDKATIEFIDNVYPDYYINAFNDTKTGDKFDWDCMVDIIPGDDQKGQFDPYETGDHLNGSSWNHIYRNKSFTDGPKLNHNHKFLWKYDEDEGEE